VVVGLLLMLASTLKAHELATTTFITDEEVASWPKMAYITLEFGFGLWLCVGLYSVITRRIAIGCFAVFLSVSLYKGISGEETCRCFGSIEISPWSTALLDAIVLLALSLVRPATDRAGCRKTWMLLGLCAPFILLGAGPVAWTVARDWMADSSSRAGVIRLGDLMGREFPLFHEIDIGERLGTGKWIVVLFRQDCPDCLREIPRYQRLATEIAGGERSVRIAIIEVPPYGDQAMEQWSGLTLGKLNETRNWFVKTPMTFGLDNRIVVPARKHLFSASETRS
jgi:thiol-disulfide isomerase/thioredoxin